MLLLLLLLLLLVTGIPLSQHGNESGLELAPLVVTGSLAYCSNPVHEGGAFCHRLSSSHCLPDSRQLSSSSIDLLLHGQENRVILLLLSFGSRLGGGGGGGGLIIINDVDLQPVLGRNSLRLRQVTMTSGNSLLHLQRQKIENNK